MVDEAFYSDAKVYDLMFPGGGPAVDFYRAEAGRTGGLMTVDLNQVPVTHPAEKQALADLLTRLEHETDIPGVTQEEIDAAREEASRDMGW